ncbi:MAG TPA: 7TM diverse intracellular signaling domain-containing protein [Oligoflexus sp.]|uniref:7TM diverse intracellular signaling domain-containing protein n=1 Tax=Oligoflexus sp. TaxID=1971216 RepID=UPI002D47C221|nr:7TM diverse intracellular signaling domain-containing protein [Oligoflexus sp.]HYX37781.1 7TM diverse intracellular signaling domain-containing protein [Oligoflexus sp.]
MTRLGQTIKWAILLAFLGITSLMSAQAAEPKPGVVHVTSTNLVSGLPLKGEWRFFWNQLVTPEQLPEALQQTPAWLPVPGGWNQFKDPVTQKPVGGPGYGTYLMRINGLSAIDQPGITMPFAASCYKMWVLDANDPSRILLTLSNGVVGTSRETSIPQQDTRYGLFNFQGQVDAVYVLIQVANFHWIHGGLFFEPTVYSSQQLANALEKSRIINLGMLGIVAIIGLYNLSLFMHRREDYGSFYLAIFCFALAAIYARHAPNFLYYFGEPTERNFWLMRSIFFVANPILAASFNSFIRANFPKQSFKFFDYYCWIFCGLISIPLIFMHTTMPNFVFTIYQLSVLQTLVMLYQTFRAWRQNEEGALISLVGSAILIAAFISYYLSIYKVVSTVSVLPYAVALFVLIQSQIVAIRFTKAFRQSEKLGRELQSEVERQTRDIKSILTNIKQGIFTLVPPTKQAGDQYSGHLMQLLGKDTITGQNLDQLLLKQSDLSSDAKSQIEAALDATLGENTLAFEMNEQSFVKELNYLKTSTQDKSTFEIDWNPIINKQDVVEKILVSLRDVTEIRRLKSVAEQREEDIRILIELVQIPEERFQRFLAKTNEYITENRDIILDKTKPRSDVIRRLFMNMHTIKGAARTYALKSISTSAHDAEQYYAALQRDEVEWNDGKLMADLDEVHKILQHYQQVGEERLGWNSREKFVKIPKSRLENALRFLHYMDDPRLNPSQRAELEDTTDQIGALCYDPLSSLIEEASRGLDSLARDLKKDMPVVVTPEARILVKEKGAVFLYNIFLHLFRNSMDHGIEAAEQRLQQGKPARGNIVIALREELDNLILTYRDDGNGLDLAAIQAKGLDQGLLKSQQAHTDLEIASLIFVSGFSTKNAVSELSGRGVGLDAVRTYCADTGVAITVRIDKAEDRHKVPFHFEIFMPKNLFYWAHDHKVEQLKAS